MWRCSGEVTEKMGVNQLAEFWGSSLGQSSWKRFHDNESTFMFVLLSEYYSKMYKSSLCYGRENIYFCLLSFYSQHLNCS